MSSLVAHVDGGSHPPAGWAGIGVVLEHACGRRVEISEWLGARDNNSAEYAALLVALEYAAASGCSSLAVFSDSEVVVRQVNGLYQCQSAALRPLYESCRGLIAGLAQFTLTHIPREQNREANRLAQAAIGRARKQKRRRAAAPPPLPPVLNPRWRQALSRAAQRALLPVPG